MKKLRRPGFHVGLIVLYSVLMITASVLLWMSIFDRGEVTEIRDWATVMERRAADVPALIEIQDKRWGVAELSDNDILFQMDALIKRVPRYFGELEQDPGSYRMMGNIEYIGGRSVSFSLGEVLWMEDEPYFSLNARDELAALLRLMREQVYSETNLAGLLEGAQRVVLRGRGTNLELDAGQREQLGQILLSTTGLEGAEETGYALETREDPYCRLELFLSGAPEDVVVLLVYPNEYVEVWDMTSARGTVMAFYGDLARSCRDLLETPPADF